MQTKRIQIGAIELSYNEVTGDAPPLVMLHGLTGHRDDFALRMPDLAGEARLLAPDLRGHGDFTHTGQLETFSFEYLVDDLRALLDAWDLESCHLLGHSFGGMVALRFALAHPRRLSSLVLMSTAPFAPHAYTADTFARAGAIARARGMAFLQNLIEQHARERPAGADPQIAKWSDLYWSHHRHRHVSMDPLAYGPLGLCMVEQNSIVGRLCEIRCPTTILVGDGDVEFLPGADALEAGLSRANRITIPDAGHHPHMENPEAWLSSLRSHFERANRARTPGRPTARERTEG